MGAKVGLAERLSRRAFDACCRLTAATPHIIVAAMPKSGSTFLTDLIACYGPMGRVDLVPVHDDREQELSQGELLRANVFPYVSQLHIRNNAWTRRMAYRYKLSPIVLVRDLADCVVSVRDHIRREGHFGALMAVDDHILSLDDNSLDYRITRLAMPWYLEFYASWKRSGAPMFDYRDLAANPAAVLTAALGSVGVTVRNKSIAAALERVGSRRSRFNVGQPGRGRQLDRATRSYLRQLVDLYPSIRDDGIFDSLGERG